MEVVKTWRFSRSLRIAAVAVMLAPVAVDAALIAQDAANPRGGIPVVTLLMLAALSALLITLMLRLVRAEIILNSSEIRFRNLSDWISIPLREVSEFEITRNGLRIIKVDGTSSIAYALQRSLFSARTQDAWILDNALQESRKVQ